MESIYKILFDFFVNYVVDMSCELDDIKKLAYEIHKYSSYAASYLPE